MSVNLYHWGRLDEQARKALMRRAESELGPVLERARAIVEEVRREGDAALLRLTRRLDGAELGGRGLRVTEEELHGAEAAVPPPVREAIAVAVANVREVHQAQLDTALSLREVRPGVFAGERMSPVPSAGLYVPRGRGSFPSVMYMLAVPAAIAGVERIVAVSPPLPDGSVDPASLYAASLCGVHQVYRLGGAQAIAALAYGTESVPRVDKIAGPGSVYVAAARRLLAGVVDTGLPAGPSEAVVLADAAADPRRLALDLAIEAEHGADSSAFLVTPDASLARRTVRELEGVLAELEALSPERAGFVRQVLSGFGGVVVTSTLEEALEFVNRYAPEHLQLAVADPFGVLPRICNAGEILLGQDSPFSLANYAVGVNNVIPTGARARTRSPLSVREFMKSSSVVYVTEQGFAALKEPVAALADYEGFAAHALALRRR